MYPKMDTGDQTIRIEAPTPRASLLTSTPSSESQPFLLNPLSTAASTLFTSSPIEQNVPLIATNIGNPTSDAHAEINQQTHDYEAIDPYSVSLELQRRQLGNPDTRDLWIVATRIFFPQIYLHFSLRLPWLYWARVGRIFRDAAQAMEELEAQLERGTLENETVDDAASARGINHQIKVQTRRPPKRSNTVYSYNDQTEGPDNTVIGMRLIAEDGVTKLKRNWELFIDSLLREWKTLNLVSVLLLSAITAILQIDAASADFAIRTPALGSAICALMSLLYGCIYTIRFFDMKKVHRAMEWSKKAKQSALNPYWNPWVFLSLPVVWLTWSIMLFTTAIMTYVWRTDGRGGDDYQPIDPRLILASRLLLTTIFIFGLIHLFLAIWVLVEWDYAKLDKEFRATVNKNKGEVNRATSLNAGTGVSTSSNSQSSTPTNESQTICMAGGSTLALPTTPILSTRLGTLFLSFIPAVWLNDNRTYNLGRLVDPNRTTAQTPLPVPTGGSTSRPAPLAQRASRMHTTAPEPTIPEETQAVETCAPTLPSPKINNDGATSRSTQAIVHPVGVEIPPRSTPEKDAPPDPRSEEQGDYDERQEDLEAPAAADLTESNKPELVDKKPPQSEAAHTKSTVVLSTKSDDSAENTAIQTDRSTSGLSLAHEVTFGEDMSQVHGTASDKNLSQYYAESPMASGSFNVRTLPPLYLPPIQPLSNPHFAATRMGSSESEPLPAYRTVTTSLKDRSRRYTKNLTTLGSSNIRTLPPLYLPPIPPLSNPHFAATRTGSSGSEPLSAYRTAAASLKDWSRHYTKNLTTSGSSKIPPLSPNHPPPLTLSNSYSITDPFPQNASLGGHAGVFHPPLYLDPIPSPSGPHLGATNPIKSPNASLEGGAAHRAVYRPHSNARSYFTHLNARRVRSSAKERVVDDMFEEDVSSASEVEIDRDLLQYDTKNPTTSGSSKVPPLLPLDPHSPPSPSDEVTPSPVLSSFFSYGATDTFESQDASLEGQAGPLFPPLYLDPIPPLSGPHLGATNPIKSINSSLEDGTAHSEFNFDSQSHDSAENAATQMGSSGPGLLPVHEATFEEDVSRTPGSVSYRDLPQDYADAHTEH